MVKNTAVTLVHSGWIGVFGLFASGCGTTATTEYVNEGTVCIASTADGGVKVNVIFPTCLSSSCDSLKEASCAIKASTDTLEITSRGVVESEGGACTEDCQSAATECELVGVEPGEYSVTHGERSGTAVLPAAGVAAIVEPGFDGLTVGEDCGFQ